MWSSFHCAVNITGEIKNFVQVSITPVIIKAQKYGKQQECQD